MARDQSGWAELYPVYQAQAYAAGADVFLLKGCTVEEPQAAIVAAV